MEWEKSEKVDPALTSLFHAVLIFMSSYLTIFKVSPHLSILNPITSADFDMSDAFVVYGDIDEVVAYSWFWVDEYQWANPTRLWELITGEGCI